MSRFKKVIIVLLFILVAIPATLFGYTYYKLNSIERDESDYTSKIEEVKGVTNVLLTGTDARYGEEASRTDAMIILTIDDNHNSVKLTSLARDTYVNLGDHGNGKLNAAYFWGQEELLFETIENEFGIGIDKIIHVDFNALMSIVDTLGGVEVYVPANNLNEINKFAEESYYLYNSTSKGNFKKITSSGKQILNGYQALSFARVRQVDSAINRDNRQKELLISIAEKAKSMPVTKYPQLLNTLLPYITTNMDSSEILKLGMTVLGILGEGNSIQTAEFPIVDDIHSKGGIYKDAGWVWLYDKNSTKVLQDFIYKNINMEDNEYLKDNSNIKLNY